MVNNDAIDYAKDFNFVIVPGYGWKSTGDSSGGNFSSLIDILKLHKISYTMVDTHEYGCAVVNSHLVLDAVQACKDKETIIVSGSKGSLETAMAFSYSFFHTDTTTFDHVYGWINVSGALQGTPLANFYLSKRVVPLTRMWYRRSKKDMLGLYDLRCTKTIHKIPSNIRVLNHICHKPLDDLLGWHLRMFGQPNDGRVPVTSQNAISNQDNRCNDMHHNKPHMLNDGSQASTIFNNLRRLQFI